MGMPIRSTGRTPTLYLMISAIITFSVKNKLIVLLAVLGLVAGGLYSLSQLPVDAVPDITNNQVQIVTVSGYLAPQEVEQFITYPVEVAMANLPDVTEIRSISRFGLSVVTVVFKPKVPVLHARQYVQEQLRQAEQEIPPGLGKPELMPITTGLGEIYQYVLRVAPGYEDRYDAMELRTIQDWIVKRQLSGIPGIIEVSSFGGLLKQYEVALDPVMLQSYDISVAEVFEALARNNQNSGGSYIEKQANAYYIRSEGLLSSLADIEQVAVATHGQRPVLIGDIAKVQFGSPKRFGAMTMDGQGEAVGGITLMFKGANSSAAIANVQERVAAIKQSMPEGVSIFPYLDRSVLVGKTINTVRTNLLEGGLIVILVLVLLLGNWRAGLIVASIIPLSFLFAITLMGPLGISANLMSLGAIDFGIVVDGPVIIVEGVLHALFTYHIGQQLTQKQLDGLVIDSAARLFRSAIFGVLIILTVFVPIMALTGIEGLMFRPMAITFSFVVLGALLLSLTYVPMMAAWAMPLHVKAKRTWADRFINTLRKAYRPVLEGALRLPGLVIGLALALVVAALLLFRTLGAEFLPTLEEGDLAMQMAIPPGSSLEQSISTATQAERILLEHFPEVEHVVSKIGTAEVPTDPMAIEDADIMIILKPKGEWTSAPDREALAELMKEKLAVIPAAEFEFTQPIQLRFNELLTGAKTDIAVKIFGENTAELKRLADRAAQIIDGIPGAADVKAEQTEGLPQLMVTFDRQKIAQYQLDIERLNTLLRTAYAGETAGVIFENERKFDLVVRLQAAQRQDLDLSQLFVHLDDGSSVPMSELAQVHYAEGPMQISREGTRRRINVGVNIRDRDVASLVADIELALTAQLRLPPGYYIRYGGQFENLEAAKKRLSVAVPVALGIIFLLLYFAFGQLKYALLIFATVPLAAVGGVAGLWLRGMPFSISAGVGFIALFGVAVLNGIVLISHFNYLRQNEQAEALPALIVRGSLERMRPVLLTALTTILGFLPMALSTSNGAEVQKPLATVVITGLTTATLLTLFLLPVLYHWVNRKGSAQLPKAALLLPLLLTGTALPSSAQPVLTLDYALEQALRQQPELQNSQLSVEQARLGITAARQVPATQFTLGYGQFDSPLGDYQLGLVQPFNTWGLNQRQAAAAEAKLALAGSEQALLRHRTAFELRQAWQQWLLEAERAELLIQQQQLFAGLAERARAQLENGQISRLPYTLAQQKLAQAQTAAQQANLAEAQAFQYLQQLAYSPDSQRPPDRLVPLPLGTADTSAALSTLLLPLAQQVELTERQTEVAAKQLNPQWSLGYFQQSIQPENLFLNAVQLGLSVPIFQKSQRAQIEQAKLEGLKASNSLEGQRRFLTQERARSRQQLLALQRQLAEQGSALLAQAQALRELTQQQLGAGEIDYFQYAQSLEAALSNELMQAELTAQYNQALLYFLFLSE